MRVYEEVHRKVGENEKISKLSEINTILSRNYDVLYD
jgi:hypothetical protein